MDGFYPAINTFFLTNFRLTTMNRSSSLSYNPFPASPDITHCLKMACRIAILFEDVRVETEVPITFETLDVWREKFETRIGVSRQRQRLYCKSSGCTTSVGAAGTTGAVVYLNFMPTDEIAVFFKERCNARVDPNAVAIEILILDFHSSCPPPSGPSDDSYMKKYSLILAGLTDLVLANSHVDAEHLVYFVMASQLYEIPSNQVKATNCIPIFDLHNKALQQIETARKTCKLPSKGCCRIPSYDESFFKVLFAWFQVDFFSWRRNPTCAQCLKSINNKYVGTMESSCPQDLAVGLSAETEVYKCDCGSLTLLPRFAHPATLLQTRNGRCGEHTKCFALISRSLGFPTRIVKDPHVDHLWNEVLIDSRWVHCDTGENALDKPLLNQHGRLREISFVYAVTSTQIKDVTSRYLFNKDTQQQFPVPGRKDMLQFVESVNKLLLAVNSKFAPIGIESAIANTIDENEDKELLSLRSVDRTEECERAMGRCATSLQWRSNVGEPGNAEAIVDDKMFKMGPPVGIIHDDTQEFSDESIIKHQLANYKLNSVTVWVMKNRIAGLQCSWINTNTNDVITGDCHMGNQLIDIYGSIHTLELTANEYITTIAVRTGTDMLMAG